MNTVAGTGRDLAAIGRVTECAGNFPKQVDINRAVIDAKVAIVIVADIQQTQSQNLEKSHEYGLKELINRINAIDCPLAWDQVSKTNAHVAGVLAAIGVGPGFG